MASECDAALVLVVNTLVEWSMSDQELQEGTLVLHPNRPEWGPGKVVKSAPGKVHVVWRDLPDRAAMVISTTAVRLELAADQHDDVLCNLPPVIEANGTFLLPKERVTFNQAVEAFRRQFPLGFEDPGYIGNMQHGERHYKWVAHELFVQTLGNGQFRRLLESDQPALIAAVLRCERSLNLLSIYEKAAFKDAMESEGPARRFLTSLCEVLDADEISEAVFAPYAAAVCDLPAERGRVASWPVATIIPFIAQPERHLFLKPGVTLNAADALGFHLSYRPEPNWLTYSKLLEMGRIYREKLEPLKPRDMIDVQSFFWVACGGYDRNA